MSKINVAFAVNDKYVDHLGVTLFSLLKNNQRNEFHIYVISSDMSTKSKNKINRLAGTFKNFEISYIRPDSELFNDLPITIQHITIETYYRYILPDIIKSDRILYLDVDILVLADVAPLYNADIENSYIAAVHEVDNEIRFPRYTQSLGIDDSKDYVNAGVLLMNLKKMRDDNIVPQLFANTRKYSRTIKFQDQDIINITFHKSITHIDYKYNYTDQARMDHLVGESEAVIVHYNGPVKPWSQKYLSDGGLRYWGDQYMTYRDMYESVFAVKKQTKTKYALFSYTTDNIGDEIQSIAARRFLPRIDYYIDRDHIDECSIGDDETVKLIMNGWYTHYPENFPPIAKNIDPLLVSMYITDEVKDDINTDRTRHFLNKYGPVGARNPDTQKFLESIGVDSYFSGCLTLTLQRDKRIVKRDFVLAVDVPQSALEALKRSATSPVVELGAFITTGDMTTDERFALAELYLFLFQSAKCVVTTRLHATLPCLALGTPVLNLERKKFEPGRFAGLRELAHHLTVEQYSKDPAQYNADAPPKNPTSYLKIRKSLIETCKKYTGYNNSNGFMSASPDVVFLRASVLRPLMRGLMSSYEADYISKVLTGDVQMANNSIETANAIKNLQQDVNRLQGSYDEIVSSRAWRLLVRARKLKARLSSSFRSS